MLTKNAIEQIIEALVISEKPLGTSLLGELSSNCSEYSLTQINDLYITRKEQYDEELPPLGGMA